MTDFNEKLSDPELRRLIQRLPRRQVGSEFTARVMDEALKSLQSNHATSDTKWSTRLLSWLTGRKEEDWNGSFPVAPLLARGAFACAVIGFGFLVYETSLKSPNTSQSSAPAKAVSSTSISAEAGSEFASVSREVAALESTFHLLDRFTFNENMENASLEDQIEAYGESIPWIQDFESIQAISSEAVAPDEELLDLFGDSLR
jgi:hypothetical protein